MAGQLFRSETPTEYFKDLVETALSHQGVVASEWTSYYLVSLLCGFLHISGHPEKGVADEPLALQLGRALEGGGARHRADLRRVGDTSLFVSGYFSDSLRRKLVDVDYYVALGGYAYGSLGRAETDHWAQVFSELSEKFVDYVDILSEVSERSGLSSNTDLLRLYEKWLRTGSRRDGELLVRQGLVPNASIGSRFLQ
jgi:hypothetical protein